eukprot:IDg12989t1
MNTESRGVLSTSANDTRRNKLLLFRPSWSSPPSANLRRSLLPKNGRPDPPMAPRGPRYSARPDRYGRSVRDFYIATAKILKAFPTVPLRSPWREVSSKLRPKEPLASRLRSHDATG